MDNQNMRDMFPSAEPSENKEPSQDSPEPQKNFDDLKDNTIKILNEKVDGLRIKLSNLEQVIQDKNNLIEKNKKEIGRVEEISSEIAALQSKLSTRNSENGNLKERNNGLQTRISNLEREIQNKKKVIEDSKNQLSKLSQSEDLDSKLSDLQSKITSLETENKNISEINSEIRTRNSALEQEIQSKIRTIEENKMEIEHAGELSSSVSDFQSKISSLKHEKEELKSQNLKFQNENDVLVNNVKELSQKILLLNSKLEVGSINEDKLTEFEQNNMQLKSQIAKQEEKINDLQTKIVEKEPEINSLRNMVEELKVLSKQKDVKVATQLSEIETLNENFNDERMEKENIRQELADIGEAQLEAMEEYHNEVQSKEEKIGQLQEQIRKFENMQEEHRENASSTNANDQETITHLQEKLKNTSNEHNQTNAKYTALRDDMTALQNDNAQKLGELNTRILEKEKLLEEVRLENSDLKEKIDKMIFKDEVIVLEEKIKNLSEQNERREFNLKKKDLILNKQKEIYINLIKEKDEKLESLEKQTGGMGSLQKTIHEKNIEISELNTRIENFGIMIKEKENIRNILNKKIDKINEISEQKEVLFTRIHDLNKKNAGNEAIIARLQVNVQEMQGNQVKGSTQIEILQEKESKLEQELKDQIATASEIKGKFDILAQHNEKNSTKLDKKKKQYEALTQNFMEIKNKYNLLEHESFKKDEKIKSLWYDLKEKEKESINPQEIQKYNEKITMLEEDIQSLNKTRTSLTDELTDTKTKLLMADKDTTRKDEEMILLKRRIKLLRREIKTQNLD